MADLRYMVEGKVVFSYFVHNEIKSFT